jgi:hypothetical protein
MLRQCGDGPYLEPPYALFFWAPDVKKIWPSEAEPAPKGSLDLTHHQKQEPKAWFKQALNDMPRGKDETPGAHATRLHEAMKAGSDRLTRVWTYEGMRRALNRK